MVRCFEDEDVIHVAGKVDPLSDIEVINTELSLADMGTVDRALQRAIKASKSGNKDELARKVLFEAVLAHIDLGKPVRTMDLTPDEKILLRELHLLTYKPTMFIANVREDGFENNPFLDRIKAYAKEDGAEVVPVCAAFEAEVSQLDDADKEDFLAEIGMEEPGLNRVIRAAYKLLSLSTYFTAGVKEVRAWTIPNGATAPQSAGVIHTDFERGFIRAEVIAFNDFVQYKGEQGAKDAGKWRLEGKEYIMHDGDVVHFRFNV